MSWGLTSEALTTFEDLVVRPFVRCGARLWVFGSRARGDFKEFSDLDVLYELSGALPPGFLGEVRDLLEKSRLPIKVDLVNVAELAEAYREQVFRERKPIS
jgi:predicted nucleotidyltransferase